MIVVPLIFTFLSLYYLSKDRSIGFSLESTAWLSIIFIILAFISSLLVILLIFGKCCTL